MKSDLQQKESSLSDASFSLQMKEAELISAKLEVYQLRSNHALVQLGLNDKTVELQLAQQTVQELRKEVSEVRAVLQSKEEQLLRLSALLQEKEEQLLIMRTNLDDSQVQLSEATSIVEQIAALSTSLVDSANQGKPSVYDEESILMQTNVELFSANRKVFERELQLKHFQEKSVENIIRRQEVEAELEAVKECLREKDRELQNAQEALAQKEHEVKQLLNRWETREGELDQLREQVIAEAKGLRSLQSLLQKNGSLGGEHSGKSAVEILELEVARLEVESTFVALQSLADLSQELLQRGGEAVEASPEMLSSTHSGNHESLSSQTISPAIGVALVEDLREKIDERDTDLELTKIALEELTRLTEKLVCEAGIVIVEDPLPTAA